VVLFSLLLSSYLIMTGPDIWNLHGGSFRKFSPPSNRSTNLALDPIDVAMMVIYAHVLVSMRKFYWLRIAIGIVRDFDTFIRYVHPDTEVKMASHQTIARKWLSHLKQLADWGVIEASPATPRMAYGKFFIIPKPGTDGGRAIFDFSILAKHSARPFPVNTPHIAAALRKIGSWNHKQGYVWAADYRHWWFQCPISDPRIRSFFTLEVDVGGCKTLVFQAKVCSMGASWSAYTGHCVTWGIALGELPPRLAKLIDWSLLEGDSPPAWVTLNRNGEEIGILIAFYDNFFVFSCDQEVVEDFRRHVIRRAKLCNAKFKASYCERCHKSCPKADQICLGTPESPASERGLRHCGHCLEEISSLSLETQYAEIGKALLQPDPVGTSADFLGVIMSWDGARWTWTHRDVTQWKDDIPLSASRKEFAHFVGVILWDATVNLESLQRIDPAIDVIRRLTRGVTLRSQWKEIVCISKDESDILHRFMKVVINRGTMFFVSSPFSLRAFRPKVFVATDASQFLVAWMTITSASNASSYVKSVSYDVAVAVGPHIFYKELQAATWGFLEMALMYFGAHIFLATDNAAVYWVLMRMFSAIRLAAVQVEFICDVITLTDTLLSPILIPGIQNCSDCPSRGFDMDQDRIDATRRHLFAMSNGAARTSFSWHSKRHRSVEEREVLEEPPDLEMPLMYFKDDAPAEILLEKAAFDDLDD